MIRRVERLANGLIRVECTSGLTGLFRQDGSPYSGDAARIPAVVQAMRRRQAS